MVVGVYIPPNEWGPLPGLTANYPSERPAPVGDYSAEELLALKPATVDRSAQPIDALSRNNDGFLLGSFADDYFNRIYILPPSVNLDSVTESTSQVVRVWNTRFTKTTITQVVGTNVQGVTLTGPDTPVEIPRMGLKSYTVTVSPDGPVTIDANYRFHFSHSGGASEAADFSLAGTRAELWRLPVNWSQRYDEIYEFLSDIFTSRSGKEQRRALRNTPRLSISFQSIAREDGLRWFTRMMAGRQANAFLLPDITRDVRTTQPMMTGAVEARVAQRPDWIAIGEPVVLRFGDQSTSRMIEGFTADTLTFSTPLEQDWPVGTVINPGLPGRVAQQLRSTRLTSTVATVSVTFDVAPLTQEYDPPAPATVWRDAEVMLLRPNYANPISVTHEWPVEQVDFDRGAVKTFRPIDFGTRVWQATYLGIGRDKVRELVDIFLRAKGRRGEFYMPTWEDDLPLREALTEGSFRLRTVGTEVAKTLHGDTVFKNLAVFTHDGRVYFNRVNAITEYEDANGLDSLLVCEFAWPATLLVSDVHRVCWMPLCRFASDGLTVSWLSDEVANVTPTIVSLEDKDLDQDL